MKTLLKIILILILSPHLGANEFLFKKYKPAVVKITVSYQGVELGLGSGFFISSDGQILTNYHVIAEGLERGYSIEIKDAENKIYKDVEVGKCLDQPIDLCFLKVKANPVTHFNLSRHVPSLDQGKKIFVIGHPRGYDFTFSDGMLSGVRYKEEGDLKVEQAQITAPLSPGSSGGPIFTKDGELVAVATWIRVDQGSQSLNFGATINEIKKHTKDLSYQKLSEYQMAFPKMVAERFSKMTSDVFIPTERLINEGLKNKDQVDWNQLLGKIQYNGSPAWRRMKFSWNGGELSLMIPSFYPDCTLVPTKDDRPKINCQYSYKVGDSLGFIQFTNFALHKDDEQAFRNLHLKNSPSWPLFLIREIVDNKQWDSFKSNLTEDQVKNLWSIPLGPAQCKFNMDEPNAPLFNGSHLCREEVSNFNYPNHLLTTDSIIHREWGFISVLTSTKIPELKYVFDVISKVAQVTFRATSNKNTTVAQTQAQVPSRKPAQTSILSEAELEEIHSKLIFPPKDQKEAAEWGRLVNKYCENFPKESCEGFKRYFADSAMQYFAFDLLNSAYKTYKKDYSSSDTMPFKEIAMKVMGDKINSYALFTPTLCVKKNTPYTSLTIREEKFSLEAHSVKIFKNIKLIQSKVAPMDVFRACKNSPYHFLAVGILGDNENLKVDIWGITKNGKVENIVNGGSPYPILK